jgi:putative flippase GtrA
VDYSLKLKTPSKEIERFLRFAIVGGTGTVVDFVILIVLKEWAHLPVLLANTFSYTAGTANNFILNRTWTFPEARSKKVWIQIGQFFAVSGMGLLLNDGILWLMSQPLGSLLNQPQNGYLAAKVVATLLVIVWKYFANRYWTFSDAR